MKSSKNPVISVESLLALRQEADALPHITAKLRVKEMGPADHIRTKHEAKAFVASGDCTAAATLIEQALARRTAAVQA